MPESSPSIPHVLQRQGRFHHHLPHFPTIPISNNLLIFIIEIMNRSRRNPKLTHMLQDNLGGESKKLIYYACYEVYLLSQVPKRFPDLVSAKQHHLSIMTRSIESGALLNSATCQVGTLRNGLLTAVD
ncbi:hypothetical protein L2E82_18260 [Cichorium intybus]|uniref:Uncharacterized protein n=1 Tax=Cichorium intybus TaxID=13427 RepID=A0ACB9FAZ2_CICIN|nr:hypothetical protein L2E82_18260 [Cichorium intybus]